MCHRNVHRRKFQLCHMIAPMRHRIAHRWCTFYLTHYEREYYSVGEVLAEFKGTARVEAFTLMPVLQG